MIQLCIDGIEREAKAPPRDIIPTVFFEQKKMLEAIQTLYGPLHADVTYSTGVFWKDLEPPPLKCDLSPAGNGVIGADFTALPFESRSIRSMIIDPPFLVDRGKADSYDVDSLQMTTRFSAYDKIGDLMSSYQAALYEAYRVLITGGYLAFKCQDIVSRQRQIMTHCHVWQMATNAGFVVEDMFMLVTQNRLIGAWNNQIHARKAHSYMFVFRKPKGRYAE